MLTVTPIQQSTDLFHPNLATPVAPIDSRPAAFFSDSWGCHVLGRLGRRRRRRSVESFSRAHWAARREVRFVFSIDFIGWVA